MWLGRPTKGTEAAPAAGAHATAKVAAKIAASKAALKAGEHGATTGALHGGDYARFKQPGETVDHEERRLWARVREKMKQRRVEQDTDAAMNHARESAQQQQQQKQQNDQQQHAPGEEGKAPARLLTQGGETSKVSAWLHTISSSKSPSKAPAGATARERDRAGTALPERQDASGQGRPPPLPCHHAQIGWVRRPHTSTGESPGRVLFLLVKTRKSKPSCRRGLERINRKYKSKPCCRRRLKRINRKCECCVKQ